MMNNIKVAVLLTCFNRKEKTVNCIEKLLPQLERLDGGYKFYICDDKSTDGTYEYLCEKLKGHGIIQSEGNYYWCKGMYTVMKMAWEEKPDFYLMVNDDVDFFENALESMLDSHYKAGQSCGIVGSTMAMKEDVFTYGGRNEKGELVYPAEELQPCAEANWNCFLIDKKVVESIGLIDSKYQHAWGDYDYSFRMKRAGLPLYVATEYVGRCDTNSKKGSYKDASLSRTLRLKKMMGPKGVPFRSYMRYYMKTRGKIGVLKYVYGYLSNIGYILLKKEIE